MSHDVFEMMQKMDLQNVDLQLALQCAPLFAKLKRSNLLIIPVEDVVKVKQILKYSDVGYEILSQSQGKTTMLLYRSDELVQYFSDEQVRTLLRALGYHDFSLEALIRKFREHYVTYQQGNAEFPHEMGLFLGYPIEDVIGFIENQGKNFLYTGYWKVYANLQDKISLFQKFELAEKMLIQFVSKGGSVGQALQNDHCEQLRQMICV